MWSLISQNFHWVGVLANNKPFPKMNSLLTSKRSSLPLNANKSEIQILYYDNLYLVYLSICLIFAIFSYLVWSVLKMCLVNIYPYLTQNKLDDKISQSSFWQDIWYKIIKMIIIIRNWQILKSLLDDLSVINRPKKLWIKKFN